MTNGNGHSIGPWQVRAIAVVGIPGAIAIGLVYWLTMSVSGSISDHEQNSAARVRELTGVMRQICVNTSETPSGRSACFSRGE